MSQQYLGGQNLLIVQTSEANALVARSASLTEQNRYNFLIKTKGNKAIIEIGKLG